MEINNYEKNCQIFFFGERKNRFTILTISYIKYQDDNFFEIIYEKNSPIYIKDINATIALSETLTSYIKEISIKNTQDSSCIMEIYVKGKQILIDSFYFYYLNKINLNEIQRLKECVSCYIKSIPHFKYIELPN